MPILKVRNPDGSWSDIPALIGPKGSKGDKGDAGKTPVKGTDYFTAADKTEIATQAADLVEIPVTSVNGKTGAVTLDATDVGADASGTASAAVIAHNTATDAHTDIRDSLLTIEQGKMDATNPVCTGSFSMNRYEGTIVGAYSHTSGYNNTASGQNSHAEGYYTMASGQNSHAEGYATMALGKISHAEGDHTTAQGKSQHVQGEYNILDTEGTTATRGEYAHIVGNGTSDSNRSNAHTIDWDGNAWYQGNVYVGSTSGTNMDEGSKKLATEEYVDGNISTKLSEINSQITSALAEALQDAKESGDFTGDSKVAYAICDTEAATAAKVAAVSGNDSWTLQVGSIVMVYFSISNSASNVTLNVNDSGAYPIWYNNAEYTSTSTMYTGYAKRVIIYMFNGTHWVWIGSSYDADTNTYQRLYPTTTSAEYPITARYNTTTGKTYYAEYGRYSEGVTLNPSTKTITATAFKGKLTGNADTATKAT
jgi:hypothetical protein